ncbi:unnamed protein product, partial [Heterosigma akashiwo]
MHGLVPGFENQFHNLRKSERQRNLLLRDTTMYGNNVVHDSNKRSLEAIQSSYGEDPSKRQMTGVGQGYDTGAQQNAAEQYPRNPGQDPCAFYVRTGSCKFGQACKFDHPPQPAGEGRHKL